MALSKLTGTGKWQDEVIDELLSSVSYPLLRRGLRPWVELGLDAKEVGVDLANSLLFRAKDGQRSQGHRPGSRTSSGGSSSSNSEPESEEEAPEPLPRGLHDRLAGVLEGLVELGAELGLNPAQVKRLVLPAALTAALLCSGGGAAGFATAAGTGGTMKVFLGLGSLELSNKVAYAGAAALYAAAAFTFLERHPEVRDRSMQRMAGLTMALGCLGYAGMLAAGYVDIPKEILALVANPDLVLHWLPDLVTVPLLILNVGRIAGRGPSKMMPCVFPAVLSTAAAICSASAVVPLHQWSCLLGSAGFMLTTVTILGELPHEAGQVSAQNRRRALIGSDLLSFTWSGLPLIQALGLAGAISTGMELQLLTAIDLLMIVGTSHIVLRSNLALQSMAEHFEKELRTQRREEPQSEPPPNA